MSGWDPSTDPCGPRLPERTISRSWRSLRSSWGGSAAWLRLTADSNIIDDLIEKQREEEGEDERGGGGRAQAGGERETSSNEGKVYLFFPRTVPQLRALMWAQRLPSFYAHFFSPPSLTRTHGAHVHLLTFSSLARAAAFLFLLSPPFYEWFSLVKPVPTFHRIPHVLRTSAHLSSSSNATRTFTAASGALWGSITRPGKTWSFAQQQHQPERRSTWVWKLTQSPTTTFPSRRRWVSVDFDLSMKFTRTRTLFFNELTFFSERKVHGKSSLNPYFSSTCCICVYFFFSTCL